MICNLQYICTGKHISSFIYLKCRQQRIHEDNPSQRPSLVLPITPPLEMVILIVTTLDYSLNIFVITISQVITPFHKPIRCTYLFPSEQSQRKHVRRSRRNGHLVRYEKQGNHRATILRGIDNYILSYWRVVQNLT